MDQFIYKTPLLPDGFTLPRAYEMLMRGTWPKVAPWEFLAADMALSLGFYGSMLSLFRDSPIIPFAFINSRRNVYRGTYDVLACFDGLDVSGDPKVRIYDSVRRRLVEEFPHFLAWLEAAQKGAELASEEGEIFPLCKGASVEPFLYTLPILPDGFVFPQAFENMILGDAWPQLGPWIVFPHPFESMILSSAWPQLEPWTFYAADMPRALRRYGFMLERFQEGPLIPFACIDDATGWFNDGYIVDACFDGTDLSGDPVVRIFDSSKPKKTPWENYCYPNFLAWLEDAKRDAAYFRSILEQEVEADSKLE